jgi:hypothetical protein
MSNLNKTLSETFATDVNFAQRRPGESSESFIERLRTRAPLINAVSSGLAVKAQAKAQQLTRPRRWGEPIRRGV